MPTLFDYYKKKGQALPSVQERSSIYERMGLGSATEYRGNADQNTRLLSRLESGDVSTAAPKPEAAAPEPEKTVAQKRDDLVSNYEKPAKTIIDRIVEETMKLKPAEEILREERTKAGVPQLEQEINDTQSVIDGIRDRLRRGVTKEGERPIEADLVRGRQRLLTEQENNNLAAEGANLDRLVGRMTRAEGSAASFASARETDSRRMIDSLKEQLQNEGQYLSPLRKAALEQALKDLEPTLPEIRTVGKSIVAVSPDGTVKEIYAAPGGSGSGSGSGSSVKFTASELKKLEAAGLLDAARSEQLSFLGYGEGNSNAKTTYQDFAQMFVEEAGGNPNQSFVQGKNPDIDRAYAEYLKSTTGEEAKKYLSATDKKKMIASGLDPASSADVVKFIEAQQSGKDSDLIEAIKSISQ